MRQPNKPSFSVEYRGTRKPSSQKVFDLTEHESGEPDFEFNQEDQFEPLQSPVSDDDAYEQALRAAEAAFEKREVVPPMQRREASPNVAAPKPAPPAAPPSAPPQSPPPAVPAPPPPAAEKIFTKPPEPPEPPAPEGRILPDLTEKPVEDERHARRARTAKPPKVPPLDKENATHISSPASEAPAALPVQEEAAADSVEEPEWGFGNIPLAPPIIEIAYPARQSLTKGAGADQTAISAARRARWARLEVSPRRTSH